MFKSAVGFELWSMSKDILFDNIIITEEIDVADHWATVTFDMKRQKIASDSVSNFCIYCVISKTYIFYNENKTYYLLLIGHSLG